jgi:ATP-binding cassette, subfamily F, member 3
VLSGGERSRLALIKLLVEPFNFLVLDEPTNHLDMRSKDLLKQALCQFSGTLILVSHDREFLEGLANKVYEFKEHSIIEHLGSIHAFLEKKKLASLKDLEIRKRQPERQNIQTPSASLKMDYYEKKAYNRSFRSISKKISDCENAITSLEEKLDALAKKMESPDYSYSDPASHKKFEQYSRSKKELDEKMAEWERLHVQLSQLKENEIF